jgi:hypothetical protein
MVVYSGKVKPTCRKSAGAGTGAMRVEIHAPTVHVLLISLLIALLALVCYLYFIPYLSPSAHWIALIAYAVLGLGATVKA